MDSQGPATQEPDSEEDLEIDLSDNELDTDTGRDSAKGTEDPPRGDEPQTQAESLPESEEEPASWERNDVDEEIDVIVSEGEEEAAAAASLLEKGTPEHGTGAAKVFRVTISAFLLRCLNWLHHPTRLSQRVVCL